MDKDSQVGHMTDIRLLARRIGADERIGEEEYLCWHGGKDGMVGECCIHYANY
jgi:hypothetical protein